MGWRPDLRTEQESVPTSATCSWASWLGRTIPARLNLSLGLADVVKSGAVCGASQYYLKNHTLLPPLSEPLSKPVILPAGFLAGRM